MDRAFETGTRRRMRMRAFIKRCLSRAADMVFQGVEIAYYPLLLFGIAMILYSG